MEWNESHWSLFRSVTVRFRLIHLDEFSMVPENKWSEIDGTTIAYTMEKCWRTINDHWEQKKWQFYTLIFPFFHIASTHNHKFLRENNFILQTAVGKESVKSIGHRIPKWHWNVSLIDSIRLYSGSPEISFFKMWLYICVSYALSFCRSFVCQKLHK